MASVYLENINKVYKETLLERDMGNKALNGISLEIKDGETMSVLGPSGCGKTTLLKVIAGLESIEEGSVYYNRENVTALPPRDRGIGMVFQDYALYPNYKSKGNLSFFFWVHKAPQDKIDERVRETSRILGVGFDKLLGRMPTTLSGGQQQRVAIGRCIVRHPTIFLMDEPISNLDAKLRVKTRGEIKRLLMKFGISTVYVTHDQTEAISMGDRIAVMRRGKIIQVGTYNEIYNYPINRFVAEFIGKPPMNFFEGEIINKCFETDDFSLPLPSEKLSKLNGNRKVSLGIRPQDISFNLDSKKNVVKGIVEIVEPNFEEKAITVYLNIGNQNCCIKTDRNTKIKIGDKIEVVFDTEKIYLFERKADGKSFDRECN